MISESTGADAPQRCCQAVQLGCHSTVYRLQDDHAALKSMQATSNSDGEAGLRCTHGLIGSEKWWNCIANTALAVHVVKGEVSGFWLGQWGDGPAEFELRSADGVTSRWLCQIAPREASSVFCLGRQAIVEYVEQELKTPFAGSTRTNVVVRIAVELPHAES
jgi:hypothetical protein